MVASAKRRAAEKLRSAGILRTSELARSCVMPSCASSLSIAACIGERRDMSFHASVASCASSMRRMSFIFVRRVRYVARAAARWRWRRCGRRRLDRGQYRHQRFGQSAMKRGAGRRLDAFSGRRSRHAMLRAGPRDARAAPLRGPRHFDVDGRDHFDLVTRQCRRTGSPPRGPALAHLRQRAAHVLGDVSLNSHLATSSLIDSPTAVTMRTLRLSGTSFHASTCSPGTLTLKNRASAARSAGGVSNTAGSPPRS